VPRTGFDLGADIADLEHAGKVLLPSIAETFGQAKMPLGQTDSGDSAFVRPAEFGGGSGPVLPAFSALRSTMIKILQDAQDNLDLAGHALVLTAQSYRASDESAASKFKSGYNYEYAHLPTSNATGQ
jgi:hypothetical protein